MSLSKVTARSLMFFCLNYLTFYQEIHQLNNFRQLSFTKNFIGQDIVSEGISYFSFLSVRDKSLDNSSS